MAAQKRAGLDCRQWRQRAQRPARLIRRGQPNKREGQLGGRGLLDQVLAPEPTDVSQGNAVLGQIFGSREVSRSVAQNAAAESGVNPGLLKKMLPMLAMLVAGYIAKQHGGGQSADQADAGGGGLGGLLGGLLGGRAGSVGAGGLGSTLDMNGDGNALDDILRMAGKALR